MQNQPHNAQSSQDKTYSKKFVWLGVFVVALLLIPLWVFIIGGYILFKIYKSNLEAKKKRLGYLVVGFFTLVIGFGWANAITTNSEPKSDNQAVMASASPSPTSTPQPSPIAKPSPTPQQKNDQFLVTKVIDGDTIEIEGGQKVRYIGIDTPENTTQKECYGVESTNINREMVEGKIVRLERDISETDKYDRLLRYVFLEDGTFVNVSLVAQGYANASSYSPDVKYQEKISEAEKEARQANRGLWSSCQATINTQPTQIPKPSLKPSSQETTTQQTQPVQTNTQSSGGDKDCADFSTQSEAQAYFNAKGGSASNNVDRLDGKDRDGIVCESLP